MRLPDYIYTSCMYRLNLFKYTVLFKLYSVIIYIFISILLHEAVVKLHLTFEHGIIIVNCFMLNY